MANISPGVYTKIIDLSTYVQAIPSTIGFICALTEKGEDNKLRFVGGRSSLISEWGEPNIKAFGKYYGQGLYHAYNYLGESGSLYFMRALPDDAAFANMRLDAVRGPADSSASIEITYISSANSEASLQTELEEDGDVKPIGVIYPIGRGEYYNGLSIRFTEHSNPLLNGVYVMDVYEKQSDGEEVIIESFEVSFNPFAKDQGGESIWIGFVLNQYSSVLKFMGTTADENYTSGYELIGKVYDSNISTVSVDDTDGAAQMTDSKQDFSDWEAVTNTAEYVAIVKDDKGNTIYGWLGSASSDGETVAIFDDRFLDSAVQRWAGNVERFNFSSSEITYQIKKSITSVAEAFQSSEPKSLKKGSEGSLLDAQGNLNVDTAKQVLSQAYAGAIDEDVLDVENIYYSLVFDCGYPKEVKNQIATLVQTRRDAFAVVDNGDNPTYSDAIDARTNDHTFNTYLVGIFENYSRVYDIFTGDYMWVSPNYHMSYLLPRNDNVAEIWYAAAGLQRGSISGIDEIRYNPRVGQRDQLYLNQLNPIIKLSEGYVVWSQLTSQSKPSALQDINIVRTVLYIKRALERYCRYYIFQMNTQTTWSAVASDVTEFLEQIRRAKGLYSYTVSVGATEYEKKTKQFHVDITLEPTRVVEKINLNFFIK